jgi:anti-anti-sigma factor
VNDPQPPTGPVVVCLPPEIDLSNAAAIAQQLRSALTPGVTVVIADMTATVFCDCAGITPLVQAHHRVAAHGAELRVAAAHVSILRILRLTGLDRLLSVYPSLAAALEGGSQMTALAGSEAE